MKIDKEKLKRRFSRSAPQYDQYAEVQKHMGRRLLTLVPPGFNPASILEIGCGTGTLTQALAHRFPQARITAADMASGMLQQARTRLEDPRITWLCADAEEMPLNDSYDLIISNATFQWFNDPSGTLARLQSALAPGGALCFSTFGSDTFRELHTAWQDARRQLKIDAPASPGQSFYTLDELTDTLQGLIETAPSTPCIRIEEETVREHFASCLDFLMSIKHIGANRSMADGSMPVPGLVDCAMALYDERFRENDRVYATYHCLYACISESAV